MGSSGHIPDGHVLAFDAVDCSGHRRDSFFYHHEHTLAALLACSCSIRFDPRCFLVYAVDVMDASGERTRTLREERRSRSIAVTRGRNRIAGHNGWQAFAPSKRPTLESANLQNCSMRDTLPVLHYKFAEGEGGHFGVLAI